MNPEEHGTEAAPIGRYIPPAKLKAMMMEQSDRSSEQYQRQNWEVMKKQVCGQINRVNVNNVVLVLRALFKINLIRARGLLVRAVMKAQSLFPAFSHIYAALIAVINSKFPVVGQLLLRRLVIRFRSAYPKSDIPSCVMACKFIAHLLNQRVVGDALVLEILHLLVREPTDDTVEVAVNMLKDCGATLELASPMGMRAICDRLRAVLSDCDTIKPRTQFMIESLFYTRKMKFKDYPSVLEALDLIEEDDQITHIISAYPESSGGSIENELDVELHLNVFHYDPEFEKNEAEYEEICEQILAEGHDSDEPMPEEQEPATEGETGSGVAETDSRGGETTTSTAVKIVDETGREMVEFRKRVYLTIQSSLSYEEAAHKLIKNELRPKMEDELCHMIVDCCAQQRTYDRFYGLLAERFCRLRKEFQVSFENIARDLYNTIHRLDMTKLRTMAKFVAHLLSTDAVSWNVLEEIKLNEKDTTSSSRIYVKILFQELGEIMSLQKIYERMNDPSLKKAFAGIFPRDHPKNMRFAINFFSLIGLGGLTIDLRKHLSRVERALLKEKVKKEQEEKKEEEDKSSSSTESDTTSSSGSASTS